MSDWWVYDNWTESKAKVHWGACSFCKHGKGIHPNKTEGVNMKWRGPYPTRDEAWAIAQSLGRKDTDFCAYCRPQS